MRRHEFLTNALARPMAVRLRSRAADKEPKQLMKGIEEMKAITPLTLALLLSTGFAVANTANVDVYGIMNIAISDTDPATKPFPLWHNSFTDRNGTADALLSFGTLLVGTKEDCAYTPVDGDGNSTMVVTMKIKMVTTDGTALGTINHRFSSEPFQASAPMPACGFPPTTNSPPPIWTNMGIARAGGNAYIVVGTAYSALTSSFNDPTVTLHDASSYTFAVYNPDGSLKWKKRLTGLRGDWSFDSSATPNPVQPYQGMIGFLHKSAVGDFLNADGNDEIRVASVRKVPDGLAYTYTFYDVLTGSVIKKVSFVVK